jgi:methylthioxylose transferase
VTTSAPARPSPLAEPAPTRRRPSRDAIRTGAALAAWTALVVVSIKWGEHVVAVGDRLRIHAPPLAGDYRDRSGTILLAPIAVAGLVVALGPRLSRTLRWRMLLALAMATAIVWAVTLGLNDGWQGLTHPLLPQQYLRTVPRVGNPLAFLRTFTDRLSTYNIHTQGHPPGMVLILWTLDRLGLGGTGPNLALVLAGGAASISAALVASRNVAGEAAARAATPFLVLAPAAIWWSSGDAFFAGVSAWAVTLVILATGKDGSSGDRLALAGGLLFGVTAMLSYGLVLLAVIPVVVAIARRRARPLVVASIGPVLVFFGFLAAGFNWFDGLAATRTQYWAGVASRRPYSYFVVGDLGAFALAVGPAAAVGLAHLRDRRTWLLVGGVIAVIALADLSGMSKAEVERIWLPFVPWMLLATAAVAGPRLRTGRMQALLLVQGALAIVIQAAVRSPW